MPTIDVVVESDIKRTVRIRQLEAMFDCPMTEKCALRWSGSFPIDDDDWNIGLIVGPSGCGKSTIARDVFGEKSVDSSGTLRP